MNEPIKAQPDRWVIFQRTSEVATELHVAMIRLVAIFTFYAIHSFDYFTQEAVSDDLRTFHGRVTLLSIVWILVSACVMASIYSRRLPTWTKYLTTCADITLLTAVAALGNGANSYYVVVFLLIIATATMRFSGALVLLATVTSLICYVVLVGATDRVWFDENHEVPLVRLFVLVASIIFSGVIGGQIVQRVRNYLNSLARTD